VRELRLGFQRCLAARISLVHGVPQVDPCKKEKENFAPKTTLAVAQMIENALLSHAAHTQAKPPLFTKEGENLQIKTKDLGLIGMSNTQRDWLTVIRVTNS
jgi:hypothetical protein